MARLVVLQFTILPCLQLLVYAVFLDASKAFDRVLHMKLFETLIQRKVSMCFVRLLKHWYKEQTMQIKWGKHFSELFHVSNGVRQGEY